MVTQPPAPPKPGLLTRLRGLPHGALLALSLVSALLVLVALWLRQPAPEAVAPAGAVLDAGLASSAPEGGLRGPRALRGEVQDDQGARLADALVRVSSPAQEGQWRETRSDEQGAFAFTDLPDTTLRVEVTRAGHEARAHTVHAHEDAKLTFVLPRQGELQVALRDDPGLRVDDAEIVITGPGLWPAQAARADAQGEALFQGLAAGAYQLRARRGSRVAVASELVQVVPGQRTQAELTLSEGASITGVTLDARSREPLPGVTVSIQDLTPGIDALTVRSDEAGRFSASGLWPGDARIDAQREGYAPTSRELELEGAGRVELALLGAAALSGRVVDSDGAPIAGAQLSVATDEGLPLDLAGDGELGVTRGPVPPVPRAPAPDFALGTFATETDRAGAFHIGRLTPAPLVLHAAKAGYVSEQVPVEDLEPHGKKTDLRVVLRRAGSVAGRVTDARGVGLALVYVLGRVGSHEQSAVTNRDGEYLLRDVLGDVTVEAKPDGQHTVRCRTQVAADERAHCDLRAQSALHALSVRVVDEYGSALEGARVTLSTPTRKDALEHSETGVSGPDGTVTLGEMPPPPYTLDVALPGYVALEDLPVNDAARELRVQLARAATLAGTVVDVLGRAVPGAFVSTEEGESHAETDARGEFVLAGVAPGTHSLVAHHTSAGEGRSAEVRARASDKLDGVRIGLKGRYRAEPDASAPRPVEERTKPSDYGLELRGRVLVVTQVAPQGAAARAGLRVGDVVTAIDGEAPLTPAHARGLLHNPADRAATVRVLRDRRPINLRYRRPAL